MSFGDWQIVGGDYRELQLGTTIGDALRRLVRGRFKNHAAKKIEAMWGLDARTARNVISQGHVSERTLTKAALAERWALWMALGEELFGQSYVEWEEERLTAIMEEAGRDLERVRRLRPSSAALSESAPDLDAAGSVAAGEGVQPAGRGKSRSAVRAAERQAEGHHQGLTSARRARR